MALPKVVTQPPFNVTRSSHVRLRVRDLAASRQFYTEVLGLVVSDEIEKTLYLRGVEEACHHSLVLTETTGEIGVECVGMRVYSAEDIETALGYFSSAGMKAERIELPFQGSSLRVQFDAGSPPIELCASMTVLPRQLNDYPAQKGGRLLRMDHYQIVVPDVDSTAAHLMALGFRPSKFTRDVDNGEIVSIFLTRKNNPHDIVLARGGGPRMHHFCYILSDLYAILRCCDIAASYGFGREVEHGIGRHGPPNGVFAYIRDPDGFRIELGLPPMQFMDPEEQPNTWASTDGNQLIPWGAAPPERWRTELSPFVGLEIGAEPEGRWLPQV